MASIDLCNECPSNYSKRMERTVICPYTGVITCSVHLYPVLYCIKSFCVASSVSLIRCIALTISRYLSVYKVRGI